MLGFSFFKSKQTHAHESLWNQSYGAEPSATANEHACHGSCSEQHAPRQARSSLSLNVSQKNMKNTKIASFLLIAVSLIYTGCSTLPASMGATKSIIREPASTVSYSPSFSLNAYRPIDPVFVGTFKNLDSIDAEGVPKYVENKWPGSKESDINPLLPNHSASVVTYKRSESFGLTYVPASVAIEKGDYRVVMDYIKYRDEPIYDSNKVFLGNGRVGVGLRLVADLNTSKADLNLGSLFLIGVNAKQGYLKGSLYVNVIGMDSSDITNLIPLSSVIDETAIQSALQSLAAVKSKLHESSTLLTPHIVAVSIPEK